VPRSSIEAAPSGGGRVEIPRRLQRVRHLVDRSHQSRVDTTASRTEVRPEQGSMGSEASKASVSPSTLQGQVPTPEQRLDPEKVVVTTASVVVVGAAVPGLVGVRPDPRRRPP